MGAHTDHSTMLKSTLPWDILLKLLWFTHQVHFHEGHLHMHSFHHHFRFEKPLITFACLKVQGQFVTSSPSYKL